ncbi:MAG: sugar phosphate isomerase/epimerase [Clostridia bacterium]|nr:sugar phosphate isomerase/epimerase [Clostridia bacterium]MBR5366790.1 sugar phosphate isomerase/epimerase [Clostridia bacterium]
MKIGVMLDSFRLGMEENLEKAAALGVSGVQLTVDVGDLTADALEAYPVKSTLDLLGKYGLALTALCGLSGYEYDDPIKNGECVEKTCRALDLAVRMGCGIVTSHIGVVPREECPKKEAMRDALNRISAYGDSVGACFAVETGPEPGEILGGLLDSLDGHGVKINLDPANLVMCADDRPENALRFLGKYVVHTHAKDGLMVEKHLDDENLMPAQREDYRRALERERTWYEMPLGEGDVDFDIYLPALAATGFDGWLTIEREVHTSPEHDIALAVTFLREKLAAHGIPLTR